MNSVSRIPITSVMKAAIIAELQSFAGGFRGTLKLTWNYLEKKFGPTRQALDKHRDIRAAYQAAKIALRKGVRPEDKIGDLELLLAKRTEEITALKQRLAGYDAKWVTWLYNAAAKGMTEDDLNRPIPETPIMRERKNRQR